jgi:hypothetical protein
MYLKFKDYILRILLLLPQDFRKYVLRVSYP